MNKPVGLDYALLMGIGLFWGSQFALNEVAIGSFSPLTIAAGRVFIGFLTLSAALLLRPQLAQAASRGVGPTTMGPILWHRAGRSDRALLSRSLGPTARR